MFLGIEIGGTKLQLAVGSGDGSPPKQLERRAVDAQRGAAGILAQIQTVASDLLQDHPVRRIGIGFGGPVDAQNGRVIKSHQIPGWDNVDLSAWCQTRLGMEARIDNDCNVAALAEAQFGAGCGRPVVFYITVGTGVGGGMVVDGQLFGSRHLAVAEIGHLRPNLNLSDDSATVESLASGWGIVNSARRLVERHDQSSGVRSETGLVVPGVSPWETQITAEHARQLADSCASDFHMLTAEMVAQAAASGNCVARCALDWAARSLGWAIGQVVTIVAADVVVIGGGVSQMDASLFFEPVRQFTDRFVFPPLRGSFDIMPAALGDEVVLHGALSLAAR